MTTSFSDEYLPFFEEGESFRLRDYHGRKWKKLPPEEQDRWVEDVFRYYRNEHGFPYPVVPTSKVHTQLNLLRGLDTSEMVTGTNTIRWNGYGLVLCSHFFPHLWKVPVRNINSERGYRRTAWEAFQIDDALREAIRLAFRLGHPANPSDLLDAFNCGCGKWWVGVPARFKPSTAKFIWETYAPEGGIVYDYACGWGGRLLGALSSKKGLTYVGVDPHPETYQCLTELGAVASKHYGSAPRSVRLTRIGSEDYCPTDLIGKVDVSFSSPPYFNLEAYGTGRDQSHVKFETVNEWLEGYMERTIALNYQLLKPGGYFGINIKDTAPYKLVDAIVDVTKAMGFVPERTWQMEMKQRRGHGMPSDVHFNYEPIFMFQKT